MNVQALHIEKEFLYWTNGATKDMTHGTVHKAFTEPFIEALPIQSYFTQSLNNTLSITTNEYYVFFTGEKTENEQTDRVLFGQLKKATFTTLSIPSTPNKISEPVALLAYRDTSILISNNGFISQLDL